MPSTKWVWDVVAQAFVQPQSTWAQIDALVASGGGMSNPMSALGDIIYESATPAPVKLSGNITTSKKFLSQTGTGAISAVPSWQRILCPDIDYDANFSSFIGGGGGAITSGIYNASLGALSLAALTSGNQNLAIGVQAMQYSTACSFNVAIGYNAGCVNTGNENTLIGAGAGLNCNSDQNIIIGFQAFYGPASGGSNTIIGADAFYNPGSAQQNVAIGSGAGNSCQGSFNTLLGMQAGQNYNGSNSVFIGYGAGFSETNGHRLYITHTYTDTPTTALIYGEFDNQLLRFNTLKLGINVTPSAAFHLPAGTAAAGTAPQKFTAGTLLAALELGAFEFVDDATNGHLYITRNIAGVLTRTLIV